MQGTMPENMRRLQMALWKARAMCLPGGTTVIVASCPGKACFYASVGALAHRDDALHYLVGYDSCEAYSDEARQLDAYIAELRARVQVALAAVKDARRAWYSARHREIDVARDAMHAAAQHAAELYNELGEHVARMAGKSSYTKLGWQRLMRSVDQMVRVPGSSAEVQA